jgi:hypothetical protein
MTGWSPVDLLPGLWLGLLVAAAAAALRRWYDPLPGRVLAAFGLAVVALFGEGLLGGGILLPLDNLRGHAPFQELAPSEPHGNLLQGDLIQLVSPSQVAVRRAWGEGRWPLWNPHAGAGTPLLADPQAQALQPLTAAGYSLPWMRAAALTAALRVWLALAFTFLFLRRQGLGEGPAAAGALGFGLGGFVVLWVGWPLATSAVLLPGVLYALTRVIDGGARRDSALLAALLFALLTAGHPETVAYVLLFALAFLATRLARRRPGDRARRLARAMAAGLVGALLAAPALLPALELLPGSLRATRLAAAPPAHSPDDSPDDGSPRARPVARLLPVAAPNAFGNSRFVHYWGPVNTNEDAGAFVGTALLLAALMAPFARRRLPGEGLALGVAALGLAAVALGAGRAALPLGFALAWLGAATLERFRRGEGRPLRLAAAAGSIAVGLAALLAWAYLAHPDPADPARLEVFRFGWLRWQLRFLVAGAGLLLVSIGLGARLGRRFPGWRPAAVAVIPAVAALVAAELLLLHRPANPPMPERLALPEVPAIAFLRENLGGQRMAGLGRAFPPNLPSLYGLADARVYNPAAPADYFERLQPILAGWWGEIPELGAPGHPLYRRLGVRFLVTGPDESLPLRLAWEDSTARVWSVQSPRPLLFLVNEAEGSALEVARLDAQHVTARLRLPAGADLATSLYQDGNWRLLVDGRFIDGAGRAGGPFVAARLPAGARRLDLLYRPGSFLAGLLLAAAGLALGAAWWVGPPTAPAPRPAPGAPG